MRWQWWLSTIVIGVIASAMIAKVLLARQGILTTNDGRMLSGDIQNAPDGDSVSITLHGATLTVPRSTVASINYPADAQADFRQRMGALDANDITGRIELARYELAARQYDLATQAATDAQKLDPHNPDIAILLDTISSQQALDAKAVQSLPTTAPSSAASSGSSQYLTIDDVDTIRRCELRPADNVRVQFFNNVRRRFVATQGNAAAFYAEPVAQQALDILQSGDPKLMKDVRIASDPTPLLEFRTQVQPRILAGCAAAGCHNSSGAGDFALFTDAREVLPAYTNLYILEKTGRKVEGGDTFGGGAVFRPMIDRLRPESSLLLQFGLPRSVASTPHPEVSGYNPMFSGVSDPKYLMILQWITSLTPIAPDYGIKFQIPTGKAAATQGS